MKKLNADSNGGLVALALLGFSVCGWMLYRHRQRIATLSIRLQSMEHGRRTDESVTACREWAAVPERPGQAQKERRPSIEKGPAEPEAHREALEKVKNSALKRRLEMLIYQEKHLSLRDEDEVHKFLEEVYPGFMAALHGLGKLSRQERLVSMLLKLGFQPKGIGILTNHALNSISSTRARLYEKIMGRKGTAEDWDRLVRSL